MIREATLVCIVLSIAPLAPVHADYVVAGNLPETQLDSLGFEEVGWVYHSDRYNYDNISKGQAFIPRVSGTLTEIDALIAYGIAELERPYPPLRVSVFTSDAGIPLTHLATREFPKEEFTEYDPGSDETHTRFTVDFSEFLVPLLAGSEYIVTFSTPFGDVEHSPYLIGYPNRYMGLGITASVARDGHTWERFGDVIGTNDAELAIEVRAIPEPESIVQLLLASLILASATRCSRCCRLAALWRFDVTSLRREDTCRRGLT